MEIDKNPFFGLMLGASAGSCIILALISIYYHKYEFLSIWGLGNSIALLIVWFRHLLIKMKGESK